MLKIKMSQKLLLQLEFPCGSVQPSILSLMKHMRGDTLERRVLIHSNSLCAPCHQQLVFFCCSKERDLSHSFLVTKFDMKCHFSCLFFFLVFLDGNRFKTYWTCFPYENTQSYFSAVLKMKGFVYVLNHQHSWKENYIALGSLEFATKYQF